MGNGHTEVDAGCVEGMDLSNDGARDRGRTCDLLITNQLLYQLSYTGGPVHAVIALETARQS